MLQKATVFVNRGHSLASILPWNEIRKPTRQATAPVLKSPPKAWTNTADSIGTRTAFVTEVAVALHQSEMILLRAYMTIWMASFYGTSSMNRLRYCTNPYVVAAVIYLVAVFWLPNRQYFATQSAMTTFEAVGNSVTRLLLLCGMEIFFLGGYFVLISRLGVSGVYQLAFVLWSQRLLVLSNTIYLTIDIVGFPLAHTGNDIILPLK